MSEAPRNFTHGGRKIMKTVTVLSVECVRRAIRSESRAWRRNLPTEYIRGIIFGLRLALDIVNEAYKESKGGHPRSHSHGW